MTQPITRPVSLTTFGGVTYDENSLVKKWTTNKNGIKRYHMRLKPQYQTADYQTIEVSYPRQKETNGAKVLLRGTDDHGTGCPSILVSDLAYGKILGSQDNEHFILRGCNGTELDISNDDRKDWVRIENSVKHKSQNNTVIGGGDKNFNNGHDIDDYDEATIVKDSYGKTFTFEPNGHRKLKETPQILKFDYTW